MLKRLLRRSEGAVTDTSNNEAAVVTATTGIENSALDDGDFEIIGGSVSEAKDQTDLQPSSNKADVADPTATTPIVAAAAEETTIAPSTSTPLPELTIINESKEEAKEEEEEEKEEEEEEEEEEKLFDDYGMNFATAAELVSQKWEQFFSSATEFATQLKQNAKKTYNSVSSSTLHMANRLQLNLAAMRIQDPPKIEVVQSLPAALPLEVAEELAQVRPERPTISIR